MPKSYRYLHLDVFTARRFGGNQLAVFPDARGLATGDMQAVAKEMNFSESTFVLPAESPDTDVRVRIFTPAEELPIAGHPTIGTAFALAATRTIAPRAEIVTFGLGVGPTRVDLTWQDDDLSFASMTQPRPTFGATLADPARAAAMLRVRPEAIATTRLPIQVVSCGVPYLVVPMATRADVDASALDISAYERLGAVSGLGNIAVYLFSAEEGTDGATVYTRMFAPALGIGEDPATGSAAGPLGCYLLEHAVLDEPKAATIVNLQGVRMGRPSVIHVAIAREGGTISRVRVGGEAVLVGEGTLYV